MNVLVYHFLCNSKAPHTFKLTLVLGSTTRFHNNIIIISIKMMIIITYLPLPQLQHCRNHEGN
jgi:hypothetical protein